MQGHLRYHSQHEREFAWHDYHNVFLKTLRDLDAHGLTWRPGIRVLDLGCGQRFAFSLLAASKGARVTAADVNFVKPVFLPTYFVKIARGSGLKRAAMSVVRRVLFDGVFFKALAEEAGTTLDPSAIEFVQADPTAISTYPLPDGSFDLIVSNAVLEHVANVGDYAREVQRLLSPGGFYFGLIHNYYSLSGGHVLDWAYPDRGQPKDVEPWDHLRKREHPTHVYLNDMEPQGYADEFAKYLTVLALESRDIDHDPGGYEGEALLTDEIAHELAQYPRELLLTRAYALICRKD